MDPLALAVHLFQRSYYASSPYDQVVDLMTAMEAAMSGSTKTEILLRLRTRCASLLAVQNDTAHAIFSDVGQLYDLRSTIVHGGEMKLNKLTKLLMSLTYTPPNTPLARTRSDMLLIAYATSFDEASSCESAWRAAIVDCGHSAMMPGWTRR